MHFHPMMDNELNVDEKFEVVQLDIHQVNLYL